MNLLEQTVAWAIYAGALEARKQRQHQLTTRSAAWLQDLQLFAQYIGRHGLVL